MEEERAPNKSLAIAIGVGVVLALIYSFLLAPKQPDVVVISQITEEVIERTNGLICIRQGAVYERLHDKPMKCAGGTYDVPATALSYPLARSE